MSRKKCRASYGLINNDLIRQEDGFDPNLWSMGREEFVPSKFKLLFAGDPQIIGRPPQGSGESGQDKSKYGGDGFAVIVKKFDDSPQDGKHRAGGGGAFVLLLAINGFMILAGYWMASNQRRNGDV
jgi:hypothetical protein